MWPLYFLYLCIVKVQAMTLGTKVCSVDIVYSQFSSDIFHNILLNYLLVFLITYMKETVLLSIVIKCKKVLSVCSFFLSIFYLFLLVMECKQERSIWSAENNIRRCSC